MSTLTNYQTLIKDTNNVSQLNELRTYFKSILKSIGSNQFETCEEFKELFTVSELLDYRIIFKELLIDVDYRIKRLL